MEYKSLYELMNLELKKMNLPKELSDLSNFISDDKKALNFIKYMVKDIGFDETQELAQSRAIHSVINFLMGKVFQNFESIYLMLNINTNYKNDKNNDKLWLYTSLYHDYGYFTTFINDSKSEIDKLVKYNVLDDIYNDSKLSSLNFFKSRYPDFFHNTYEEIENYYRYSKYHHSISGSDEKVDHGILGGALVFDRIVKNNINTKSDLTFLKMACITICQHNIFKSPNAKSDLKYKEYNLNRLCHDEPYFITKKTPLLLFLSLIDTIECTKRFGKRRNANKFLHSVTVLKNILINVSRNSISLDFSLLKKKSEEKGEKFYSNCYKKYIKSLINISQWTQFDANIEKDIITITLKPINSINSSNYHIA